MNSRLLGAAAAALLGLICACAADMSAGSSEFGATPGGVKDMKLARELVDNGQVPPPEAFVVEGMFSEHDLPVSGAPCAKLLCLRAASGIAPTVEGESAGWVQVGLSSTINPTTYQRPSLSLVLLVDTSGSMGWDYSSSQSAYGSPSAVARRMGSQVVSRLGQGDRVAIVTFNDRAYEEKGWTGGEEQHDLLTTIDGIRGDGSTNLADGYAKALELAREARLDRSTQQVRIMILTDAQPNTGGSDPASFEGRAARAAYEGIGTTVVGIGLGLGQEVMNAMVHLRGGNAFSLMKLEDVDALLADEWPWMVSPIAYDLAMDLVPDPGMHIAGTYGFPQGTVPSAKMEVATVFLSQRRGALLLRLAPDQQAAVTGFRVAGALAYQTVDGQIEQEWLETKVQGASLDVQGRWFQQPATGKTVALALLVDALKQAATVYASDSAGAVAKAQAAVDRFNADAAALADPDLDAEVLLAGKVLALMKGNAPQGDLYGQRF